MPGIQGSSALGKQPLCSRVSIQNHSWSCRSFLQPASRVPHPASRNLHPASRNLHPREKGPEAGPESTAATYLFTAESESVSCSVMFDSVQSHGLQPARLLCSWGLYQQEYWSGKPFPSPGDLPDPGIKPRSPALQADSLPSEPPGKLKITPPREN